MLCYTFFSNIKGDFVVEAKVNNEKEQKRLRKKVRVLNDLFEGSALFGGLLGGFAAIAYFNSKCFNKVFKRYIPGENEEDSTKEATSEEAASIEAESAETNSTEEIE